MRRLTAALLLGGTLAFAACGREEPAAGPGSYADLVALFKQWRDFQAPILVNGVPDYRAASMTAQHRELPNYQRRLDAIDPSSWPIPQQVDHHIVRAEMNGLDFDHRVLRPWANDPAFYVTVFASESDQPAREGHFARGAVELWKYPWPLDAASVAEIRTGLAAVPPLLDQARVNLVGTGQDLWTFGIRRVRAQSTDLQRFAARLNEAGRPRPGARRHARARPRRTHSRRGSTARRRRRRGRPASASRTTTGISGTWSSCRTPGRTR